ncbi:hypothetical protein OEB94_37930 [Streptomyces sp. ICN988]|uniref:hypothetical protein n=1 Tax=Streptomyces sp. ICN988 TaxID=2983765 RepID=UPI0021E4221D|nr:hypothetical protein [Streptomyces sp. ICN988]MCV2465055.1 hypothetical protein [Streptomyces sp. ICN988]
MPLPRDAAPTAGSDHGPGHRDRPVAPGPNCQARLRRSVRRPRRTDGGAGRRVLDPGCGTGASTAVPPAAFSGVGGLRTGGVREGRARADGTRACGAYGGGTR